MLISSSRINSQEVPFLNEVKIHNSEINYEQIAWFLVVKGRGRFGEFQFGSEERFYLAAQFSMSLIAL